MKLGRFGKMLLIATFIVGAIVSVSGCRTALMKHAFLGSAMSAGTDLAVEAASHAYVASRSIEENLPVLRADACRQVSSWHWDCANGGIGKHYVIIKRHGNAIDARQRLLRKVSQVEAGISRPTSHTRLHFDSETVGDTYIGAAISVR